jgi:general secretion pathway protein I
LSRSIELAKDRRDAGFTLIEALVALAVVTAALTAIGMLIGANVRATRSLTQRLVLLETTRAILSALPARNELELGDRSGAAADLRWRLDVIPFVADFVDPSVPSPWIPQAVVLRVQAPSGELLRVDTVRLRRGLGGGQ